MEVLTRAWIFYKYSVKCYIENSHIEFKILNLFSLIRGVKVEGNHIVVLYISNDGIAIELEYICK